MDTLLSNATGWQLKQFTLVPAGDNSDIQLCNLYIDPCSKR